MGETVCHAAVGIPELLQTVADTVDFDIAVKKRGIHAERIS